ncbi:dihydroorotase, homodimeric type [Fonsecaea erecta]|uniref:Dihydroorotase, homodimeric type n=1 Tax=Fonsecaea erecta TaxID=1367422 RepID=A0A178Z8C2_9EURO|nr:dihydroorotase, homodimeric type [Fonsecaea erecta]OAP56038.1 dihydroorotase, homodimeric type [Fonsecaea erecta]
MELVATTILNGGVDTVFVMPNLQPPITSVAKALEYRSRLQSIEPKVHYLMSLYLHPSVTPEVIAEAAAAGITGVKLYPQGVTTNSESGVPADFLKAYSPVFAAMEQHDLVLNLHGEWPGRPASDDISLEEAFLPELMKLHEKFPRLRIVLPPQLWMPYELVVHQLLVRTITAHHLYLTGEDSQTDPLAFCKPIPKKPSDRDALIKAVCSGDPKFFFGSDSAPHPLTSKVKTTSGQAVPAGVFTQPFATQLVILALEEAIERGVLEEDEVTQDHLEQFLSRSGRRFYKLPNPDPERKPKIVLERKGETIPTSIKSADGTVEIGLSKSMAPVFSLSWLT